LMSTFHVRASVSSLMSSGDINARCRGSGSTTDRGERLRDLRGRIRDVQAHGWLSCSWRADGGRTRFVAMWQPVRQRAVAGRRIRSGEEVDDPRSSRRSRQAGVEATHRHDDRDEALEAQPSKRASLEATDRGLVEATPMAELSLRPAQRPASALDHRSDELPAGLDLGVACPSVLGAPWHRSTVALDAAPSRYQICTRDPLRILLRTPGRSPDVAE
jgi:hypothetical protein